MQIAVIKTGGKQYKVAEGTVLKVEKLDVKIGEIKEFENLLGPQKVSAEILEHAKDKKIRVFKFKPKTRYKRTQGHRQPYTKIKINYIGGAKAAKEITKPEKTAKPKIIKKVAAKKKTKK